LQNRLYVVDAFTNQPFRGNPAAVMISDSPPNEDWMKSVSREMNLAETAFLYPIEGGFSLRWLTPTVEVDLCGHATLASAFVLWHLGRLGPNESARFSTRSGWLTCRQSDGWIEMDFPSLVPQAIDAIGKIQEALSIPIRYAGSTGMDYLVEVDDEQTLTTFCPDHQRIATLPVRGCILTSRSNDPKYDFVSRFFAPAAGVPEDPVTGSAHCALAPYWSNRIQKTELIGFQASARGGIVRVRCHQDRVLLLGQAVLMSQVDLFH
jgi:PhzF family phenazine biosynthesis protein